MSTASPQLPLDLLSDDGGDLHSFYPGPNQASIQHLLRFLDEPAPASAFVWGVSGTGKSHLLQALIRIASEREWPAFYLPLEQALDYGPDCLQGLESMSLLCFDGLEKVAGLKDWEEAIFDLFNRCREQENHFLISAHAPVDDLGILLPDLRTRLQWDWVMALQPMVDDEKLIALQHRATYRGFDLPEETGRYLLKQLPRDNHQLFALLDELDAVSMVERRRLTIPFVKDRILSR